MSQRIKIKTILNSDNNSYEATVKGWVRTFRNNQFIAVNDGSCIATLQVVIDKYNVSEDTMKGITTGAAISATGQIVMSQGGGQRVELKADDIEIIGHADPEKYPLQPKRHSLEFLREIAHLRFRTNTFGAVFRVRHSIALPSINSLMNVDLFIYILQ